MMGPNHKYNYLCSNDIVLVGIKTLKKKHVRYRIKIKWYYQKFVNFVCVEIDYALHM